jgi:hypothetical protein
MVAVGDYRRLNLVTTVDKYPIPNVQDFTTHLHGCRVFSKLDLKKGYYQVKVANGNICKTVVIAPFGLWEFLRMLSGLRNAGQTFQWLMDQVLAGLDYVFVYLDAILIASPDERTHQQHLRLVLEWLQEAGLVLIAEKCLSGVSAVEFLGHHHSRGGGTPATEGGSHRQVPATTGDQGHAAVPGNDKFLQAVHSRYPQAALGCAMPQAKGASGLYSSDRSRFSGCQGQPVCSQPAGASGSHGGG